MASEILRLANKGLIKPPQYCKATQYEVITGSVAYGVSSDTSDMDIYSFCIPPKEVVFPHLAGEVLGFGKQSERFEQYQKHHIKDLEVRKEYDICVYNIVKYFQLCAECNPNMIDSLFVKRNCVLHMTEIGSLVKDNRKLFLSKKAKYSFLGYAWSQLDMCRGKRHEGLKELIQFEEQNGISHKIRFSQVVSIYETRFPNYKEIITANIDELIEKVSKYNYGYIDSSFPELSDDLLIDYFKLYLDAVEHSVRSELIKFHGADVKFMYHVVRLVNEATQILTEGDIDLEKNSEHLKAIRRGEVPFEEIQKWFFQQEKELEKMCENTKVVTHIVKWDELRQLLVNCLEMYYGSMEKCISNLNKSDVVLNQILGVLKTNLYI